MSQCMCPYFIEADDKAIAYDQSSCANVICCAIMKVLSPMLIRSNDMLRLSIKLWRSRCPLTGGISGESKIDNDEGRRMAYHWLKCHFVLPGSIAEFRKPSPRHRGGVDIGRRDIGMKASTCSPRLYNIQVSAAMESDDTISLLGAR